MNDGGVPSMVGGASYGLVVLGYRGKNGHRALSLNKCGHQLDSSDARNVSNEGNCKVLESR